jgi:hypothetical protein
LILLEPLISPQWFPAELGGQFIWFYPRNFDIGKTWVPRGDTPSWIILSARTGKGALLAEKLSLPADGMKKTLDSACS